MADLIRRASGLLVTGLVLAGPMEWSGLVMRLQAEDARLHAGAAQSCITPVLDMPVNGGLEAGRARHIHDDLFARALVLESDGTRLVSVVVDTCLVDRPVFDAAKRLITEHTGIAPANVMISCSHTHSAGAVCGVHLTEPDETYRRWLPGRIADAVRCAVNNLAPAEIGWGSVAVPEHVFCRRLRVRPEVGYTNQLGFSGELAKMNWDSPHPADGEPTGPADPEAFVVALRHANGRPLALLANYSLHYVGDVRSGDVSADYFGVFSRRIEQMLGAEGQEPPFVAMMSNGTSGDINNINPKTGWRSPAPYTQIRRVAEDVAKAVHGVVDGLVYRLRIRLAASVSEVRVATWRPSATEIERARERIGKRTVAELRGWEDNYARDTLLLAEAPAHHEIPLQVFRLGELAIAGWPGEIFASTGLELKRRSRARPLFNVGLANGWYGYIPPPEQFSLGAYETWRARTCPLETNAIPKMMNAFLGMLDRAP